MAVIATLAAAGIAARAYPPRAAMLPQGVAALTVVFAIAFLLTTPRARASAEGPGCNIGWASIMSWISIFIVLVWAFGSVAGVPLAVFGYCIAAAGERWHVAALSSMAMFVFMYAVLHYSSFPRARCWRPPGCGDPR